MRTIARRLTSLVLGGLFVAGLAAFRFAPESATLTAPITSCASGTCSGSCLCNAEPLLSCNGVTGKSASAQVTARSLSETPCPSRPA